MTQINSKAVTTALATTLGHLAASQKAVKDAAAAAYTEPAAPPVPQGGQGLSDATPGGAA